MSSYEGAFSYSFRVLQALGLWTLESKNPIQTTLYKCYRCAAVMYLFIIVLSLCIDFALSVNNVLKWSFNLCMTISAVSTLLKSSAVIWNIDGINRLRKDLNRDLSLESEENKKVLMEAAKEVTTMLKIIIILFYIFLMVWMSIPFSGVDGIRLPFPIWLPFDSTISPNYEIIYAFHGTVGFFIIMAVYGTNTSIVGFTVRICAEYDILKNNIMKFCSQFNHLISVPNEMASSQLRDIIQHHQRIIGFVKRLQKMYRTVLMVQFAGSTILLMSIGLDIILVSSSPNMRLILQIQYIFLTSADLSLYCIFGTRLILKSEELANVIFGSEWYAMSPTYRRTLAHIIQRTQNPPRLIVGKMYTINLNLYREVLRTTYNILAVMWQLASSVTNS